MRRYEARRRRRAGSRAAKLCFHQHDVGYKLHVLLRVKISKRHHIVALVLVHEFAALVPLVNEQLRNSRMASKGIVYCKFTQA